METEKIREFFRRDRKRVWLVLAGIGGVLLFLCSGLFGEKTASAPIEDPSAKPAAGLTNREYEELYQQKVSALVEQIAGVGKSQVTVTLDTGVEYVYVKEEKQNSNNQESPDGESSTRAESESKTLLVEDQNGRKTALLRTTKEPKVRGVVVVCEGGGDVRVAERVTEAVSAALGIGSSRICVTERIAG